MDQVYSYVQLICTVIIHVTHVYTVNTYYSIGPLKENSYIAVKKAAADAVLAAKQLTQQSRNLICSSRIADATADTDGAANTSSVSCCSS